jgi:hypothetical protein
MGFGQALYTSCERGVVPGRSGFQFNAITPGTPPAVQQTIERLCGYLLPRNLEGALRDAVEAGGDGASVVAASPRAFQYRRTADGLFAIGSVVYAGRDYSGRFGNVFAHFLFTDDPAEMARVHPIELWDAVGWRTEPIEESELPALETQPLRMPHTPPGVRPPGVSAPTSESHGEASVAAGAPTDEGTALLASAFQALLDPRRQRRVLVVDRPEYVAGSIRRLDRILPACLREELTFITYTGDPGSATDCIVVGTTGEAPRLQLGSPSVRFSFRVFGREAGALPDPDPVPDEPYVAAALDLAGGEGAADLDRFLQWVDPVIRRNRATAGSLTRLLDIRAWLDRPNGDIATIRTITEAAATELAPAEPEILKEIWRGLEVLPLQPELAEVSTRFARELATIGLLPLACEGWWRVVGDRLALLEADALDRTREVLRAASDALPLTDPELRARAQGMVIHMLGSAGERPVHELLLLLTVAEAGLLSDPDAADVGRFFAEKVLRADDPAFVRWAVVRLLTPGDRARRELGRLCARELARESTSGTESFRGLVAACRGDRELHDVLAAAARDHRLPVVYAAVRCAGGFESRTALLAEIQRDLRRMGLSVGEELSLLDWTYGQLWPVNGPTRDEAVWLRKALPRELIERASFGRFLREAAAAKGVPPPGPRGATTGAPESAVEPPRGHCGAWAAVKGLVGFGRGRRNNSGGPDAGRAKGRAGDQD